MTAACVTDECQQGDLPCPTPARCGLIAEPGGARIDRGFMVDCDHEPGTSARLVYPFAPGVIEGPDYDDFLRQENAMSAGLRWLVVPVAIGACVGTALYFIGRAAGLF